MTPDLVYLVRHGETEWNRARRWQGWSDVPLGERGVAQARALAERVAALSVDALYTSDLARARRTAAILGAALGVEPVDEPGLREMGMGAWEGASPDTLPDGVGEAISAAARRDPEPLTEGAETFTAFAARIERAWTRIAAAHPGGRVMLVGHGGSLKAWIAARLGLDPVRIDRLSLRGNTGLSVVDFRHGRPQLVRLNDTAHLGDDLA